MTDVFTLRRQAELERSKWVFQDNEDGSVSASRGVLAETFRSLVDCVTWAGIEDELAGERADHFCEHISSGREALTAE